ncbi:DUF6511 domain-containing protein [Bartonella queenslandensis]|uniref:DUF6511 domain-containing protein n=1 Tax=Bartonella queenslandensis TaxID=481138 RepID=UPI001BAE40ED|nr:DUF6511 domain-containing protein [Bartonella queenslandensis]
MISASDFERDCMSKALLPLGEYVAEIGIGKDFKDLTREQVLKLIEVVVAAYMDELSKGSEEIPF